REDLESGLAKIREFRDRWDRIRVEGSRLFNPGWHLARDLKAMLTVSEAVARSALRREESRGAHSRTDFARSDPTWGKKNIVVKRVGGAMELSERPLPQPPADLKTILEAPGRQRASGAFEGRRTAEHSSSTVARSRREWSSWAGSIPLAAHSLRTSPSAVL